MDLCNRFVPRSIGIYSHRTGVLLFVYLTVTPTHLSMYCYVNLTHTVFHTLCWRRSKITHERAAQGVVVQRTQSRHHPSNVQVIAMSRCHHRIWSQRWWNYSPMSGLLVNMFHYFEITLAILLLGTVS